jgi:hypothetical protein
MLGHAVTGMNWSKTAIRFFQALTAMPSTATNASSIDSAKVGREMSRRKRTLPFLTVRHRMSVTPSDNLDTVLFVDSKFNVGGQVDSSRNPFSLSSKDYRVLAAPPPTWPTSQPYGPRSPKSVYNEWLAQDDSEKPFSVEAPRVGSKGFGFAD